MTALASSRAVREQVVLSRPDDFEEWRQFARHLLIAGVRPEEVDWSMKGDGARDLFAAALPVASSGVLSDQDAVAVRVPRSFDAAARMAVLHNDTRRFSALYRMLWRLQQAPPLMEDAADTDVRIINDLVRAVRRDIHKMRAFVRFRIKQDEQGADHYVAWFEPSHHILRANAAFFVNRFAAMRWSILTPLGSLHWDGKLLQEGPAACRRDAPSGDPTEDLWREYYASIFNPARLKVDAMVKEMPRRYWKNLPEAELIPHLIAGAQAREAAMVNRGASQFDGERPVTLGQIAEGVAACRRCPIGCNGTRPVAGEGSPTAALMIVGEQPGDAEEQAGRPFVGPAGQLLRQHLASANIEIGEAWVSNAVKHFKHTPQGKRRLHQTPTAAEIDMCRWWVESERMIVKPALVLALGASAARSMLGKTVSVQKVRGQPITLDDGTQMLVTTHPSYLLRLDDTARVGEERRFASDLQLAAQMGWQQTANHV